MAELRAELRAAAGLAAAWFVLWAGFWLGFFTIIALADPASLDPGEAGAFVRLFSLLGLASALLWAALARLLRPRGAAGPCLWRAVLWGAAAAAASVIPTGRMTQMAVLAPVGAAIGAGLAAAARVAGRGPAGGGWLGAARVLLRGLMEGR